jgi:hypothetical protein
VFVGETVGVRDVLDVTVRVGVAVLVGVADGVEVGVEDDVGDGDNVVEIVSVGV